MPTLLDADLQGTGNCLARAPVLGQTTRRVSYGRAALTEETAAEVRDTNRGVRAAGIETEHPSMGKLTLVLPILLAAVCANAQMPGGKTAATNAFPLFGIDLITANCTQMTAAAEKAGAQRLPGDSDPWVYTYAAQQVMEHAKVLAIICTKDGSRVGGVVYQLGGDFDPILPEAVLGKLRGKYGPPSEKRKARGVGSMGGVYQEELWHIGPVTIIAGPAPNKFNAVEINYYVDRVFDQITAETAATQQRKNSETTKKEAGRY
jgi:hypothetical protein